jgi:hypothetical protein
VIREEVRGSFAAFFHEAVILCQMIEVMLRHLREHALAFLLLGALPDEEARDALNDTVPFPAAVADGGAHEFRRAGRCAHAFWGGDAAHRPFS